MGNTFEYKGLNAEYFDTLYSNPYRLLREKANLRQKDLAALGYSIQYIYRVENGLVGTPPFTIANHLVSLVGDSRYLDAAQVMSDYFEWVKSMRSLIRENVKHVVPVEITSKEHPFKIFMEDLCRAAGAVFELEKENPHSQQFFNRLLCLHPRTLQNYFKGDGTIRGILRGALEDIGLNEVQITRLENLGRAFAALSTGVKQHGQ